MLSLMTTLPWYSIQPVYRMTFVRKYEKCRNLKVSHVLTFQMFSNTISNCWFTMFKTELHLTFFN